MDEKQYPVNAIYRARIGTDGKGVRTLVLLGGCPLKCKYCANPFTWDGTQKNTMMSARSLFDEIKIDRLYMLATKGGITFGGGEPLLYPSLIREMRELLDPSLSIVVETSLHITWEGIEKVADFIDEYYIDIKTMNAALYYSYTGGSLELVISTLKRLIEKIGSDRIIVRIPLIEKHVDNEGQRESRQLLEKIGITRFDFFSYKTDIV